MLLLVLTTIASCVYNPYEYSRESKSQELFKINKNIINNGKHVTSVGELRTLIVYAMFSDNNNVSSAAWNYSKEELPGWTKTMINNSTRLDFPTENLTHYFYEMSNGNLMLYGDVYPEVIIPKYPQKNYKSISEVNYEILSTIDKNVDYSKYDNWTRTKEGKYINVPDGKVDAIFVVYRDFENRLFFNNGWTGSAHFYLSENIITDDGVTINAGRLDLGSGVQTRAGKHGSTFLKYILAHEFGHLLFGAGHMENTTNLALMTGGPVWNASRGMNSWERARLGWNEYVDISIDRNSTIKIEDSHTCNKTYRMKLSETEWFILENHQSLSKHDWAQDRGVYIYQFTGADKFAPRVKVECADGNWNFEIDRKAKKLLKTIPNQSGYTEMNYRKRIDKINYACYTEIYDENSAWGDEYDAFDLTYNNLFSPVSNPSSKNASKIDFAIEIKEKIDNDFLLNIFVKNIYVNTPPSKPQIIGMDKVSNNYKLKWVSNKEPDLKGYNIYSFNKKNKKFEIHKYISALKDSKDVEYKITDLLNEKYKKQVLVITSVDSSGNESVKSNYIELVYNLLQNKWDWNRLEQF